MLPVSASKLSDYINEGKSKSNETFKNTFTANIQKQNY
jgi:hypothetical protein